MDFFIKSGSPEKQRSACIIIGIFATRRLSGPAEQIDSVSDGYLSALLRRGNIEGEIGQILFLQQIPGVLSERVLLVGCGKERELNESNYQKIIQKTMQTLNESGTLEAICFLSELHINGKDNYWAIRQGIEITKDTLYSFDKFKSQKTKKRRALHKLTFITQSRKQLSKAELAVTHGKAISSGIKACKDLTNMPANICTPLYLAEQAQQLAEQHEKISVSILDQHALKDLKMHSYLAVAQGSSNPAYLSLLHYKGGETAQKPIILIGKGVTFDSGGLSLKGSAAMDEMKYDMAGAAAVYGTLKAIADLNLPLNVIGILAGAENMPAGNAYRPGDILTTMSGQTVEVLNTDAEGRLVLCDVLTYVERFDPECVIDIATLTGACIGALGHNISALLTPHNGLAHELLKASQQAGDKAWQLPMDDEYQSQLESPFADMNNLGGNAAGTITAACFLSRFTAKYTWAHLDIAGTAWRPAGPNKGATGRPVALLTQFLINRSDDQQ
ncbi:leucyl aminopeptidase [Psychromonas sp. CNPT3]|uniref:leucyl aminopeptidase n=1 Tax=Psychromonas sp. CNPT3 TaxID=314282 RepID=UPI00006E50A2|nr:leucyl aminopeptidase [Psychromonas sp. CNPT3]AGH80480.1 leucyl aminopeptidase [Psychromonas sp. CNPT3]